MKKFFTLCLAFMLASLLNMSAAETYTLVGENINGVSWNPAATQNDLVYEASTDSYVITGVTMSGKFKVAKDHAWATAWGSNGEPMPTDAAYIAWTSGGDIAMCDNQTYTNCTVRFKVLKSDAASILITSDTAMSGTIDTRADAWCVAGAFSNDNWGDSNEMTALGNGVYEFWSTELPSEFKFKAKGDWSISFGMNYDINKAPIMSFDNALTDNGKNISLTTDQAYDKYRYTLTVRGKVASFRVDGVNTTPPEWAPVFEGVEEGGLYFNSVYYTVDAPGVDQLDIKMRKNGEDYYTTTHVSIPYTNGADEGQWEIIATATKGNETFSTTVNFTVEKTSSAYDLNEFIGSTGKKQYKYNAIYVLAQAGEYTYVKDDTRSVLIYGQAPKFNVGDCLQSFTAEYKDNNGQHQLIPYAFGDVMGNYPQQPEVITIDQVTVANQSKLVKIENAALNGETIGGVAFYNRFNTEIPANGTYTVTAIIGMNNGAVQLEPIAFEASAIEPFTYTEIVPANNAEVTSLSEIKITFPYDVTYDAEVSVLVMDGENMITPTVAVEGNVATLTFDAITAYGSKPSLMVLAGAFKETASNVGCQQITASWTIPTPPITYDLTPVKVTPASGSTVEKLERITLQVPEEVSDCRWAAQSYGNDFITVTDDKGNSYNGKLGYTSYTEYYYLYVENATASGTYTITVKEGVFGDEQYLKKFEKGHANPEFTLTYTIKAASLAAPTVDPANGAEVENLNTITLTFAEAVTANAEAGAITLVNNSNQNLDYAKNIAVAISEDGLTATITSEPSLGAWTAETYTMSIPAGYFVATSGAANEALSYNWKVVAPKFTYVAVDPAQGEVESLETIFIDFGGFRPRLIDGFTYPTYNLVNANGETVTTAATNYSYEQIDGSYYYKLKVTLGAKVTTPGDYFLTIPAGVFKDKDVYSGYQENAEMTFKWTVMEPDPNTYTLAMNVDPASGSTVTVLDKISFTPGAGVIMFMATEEAKAENWAKVTDANGNSYNSKIDLSGQYWALTIEDATEAGTYTVVVPKKSFYDALNATNFNDEIVLTYTIEAAPAVEDYTPVVTPAAGEVTPLEIVNTTITLPAKFASFDKTIDDYYNEIYILYSEGKIWSSMLGKVTTSEDGLSINIAWDYTPKADTEYTLIIPAGYIVLENGAKNLETKIVYTVKAEEVEAEDFTPVVSPAAGNVTKDEIKTTVLSFESPIASFNDSDVRYIKSTSGSVWCMFAGTYKIAEDKLSLTINWDFAPEVGLGYTLELPAGCIVLENGAKNLLTQVAYTVVEAVEPLATPTVDPANGAEVENLNTITLTFAEAVTANAEVGAITLVRNSDAAYDKQEAVVTISEDGLTATLTCKPVYPSYDPKWYIGETYSMSIPEGYFVAASGAANEALSYSWKIAAAKFTYVDVTPAQGDVTELSEILIGFANRAYGNSTLPTLNLVDANGNVVTTATTARAQNANGDWYAIKATLKEKVTTPGTYTLVVPADVFKDVDFGSGTTNAAFNLTWTVMEPDPNTYNFEYNVSPAEGVVTELNKIVFTAKVAGQMLMPTAEAQVANWVKVVDANGNVYNTTAKAGTGYDVTIEGITEPGDYTVTVPKGSFYDLMGSMTNPGSLNYNDEIVLHYEVVAASNVIYDYAPVSISPANGSEVETLEYIHIYFPYGVYDCLWGAMSYSQDFIKVSDDKGNTYDAKIGYGYYTEDYYIYVKDATAPGTYTIVVPEALVFDEEYSDTFESGHANPEFTLTYTIKAPVVEDFTPVVNPAAGNVTKEQIKTTVLSFESPIASFDYSDVRYAKSTFGSVWCEYAGTVTIAEDKLSLTINWDFAPEEGIGYTLELPAGCIVLENGAKNLETKVAYTVVAGPKDLAEFVVPAGINGYINYDETDVNAWAPEFPFTVSTTAYNTVAFAAELPSLPAGITAMEVIDENGEVIAVLNQDGVAPLADGEIYYVKGETTKEYVDGAELKFRFRFTHLGVSETIQFSYKVAGGNITSIADIELNGNVIVRGNDIIAPQGAAIFTVSGIRVPAEGLAPGVYVVVLGKQAVKVMVK